jgi:hypothetical protein
MAIFNLRELEMKLIKNEELIRKELIEGKVTRDSGFSNHPYLLPDYDDCLVARALMIPATFTNIEDYAHRQSINVQLDSGCDFPLIVSEELYHDLGEPEIIGEEDIARVVNGEVAKTKKFLIMLKIGKISIVVTGRLIPNGSFNLIGNPILNYFDIHTTRDKTFMFLPKLDELETLPKYKRFKDLD